VKKILKEAREESWNAALSKLQEVDSDLGSGFTGQTSANGQKVDFLCRMSDITNCKARARLVQVEGKVETYIEFWREGHDHQARANSRMLPVAICDAIWNIMSHSEDVKPRELHAKLRRSPYKFELSNRQEGQGE